MDYHFILGVLAGVASLLFAIPYNISILKKETKPNMASWIIWNITNIILFASYFSVGARSTIFVPLVYLLNGFITLALSFKYGIFSWSKLEYASLGVAALALLGWFATKNPLVALLLVILMDVSAYIPTIKKIFIYPKSESQLAWFGCFLGSLINFAAIDSLSFGIVIYPVIVLIMNSYTFVLIYFKRSTAISS